ncbi:unnamed protein product [marine sediment metagenome]|uniref:Uncharacterized protein n=1 Tax=marine sediment metagenome TaxID=412755 RepID=X0Z7V4_9ZZZZ
MSREHKRRNGKIIIIPEGKILCTKCDGSGFIYMNDEECPVCEMEGVITEAREKDFYGFKEEEDENLYG